MRITQIQNEQKDQQAANGDDKEDKEDDGRATRPLARRPTLASGRN